jgi:hypothetical protein
MESLMFKVDDLDWAITGSPANGPRDCPGPQPVHRGRSAEGPLETRYGDGIDLAVAFLDRAHVSLDYLLRGDVPRRQKAGQRGCALVCQVQATVHWVVYEGVIGW